MSSDFIPSTFSDLDGLVAPTQLPDSGVTAGQYGIATYEIDQYGRVTSVTPSPGLGDLSYTHNQVVPSATWTINHNLGKRPTVDVIDSGGSTVIGEVVHLSVNSVRLDFSSAFGGTAYLN
jgi:hypothetical protein